MDIDKLFKVKIADVVGKSVKISIMGGDQLHEKFEKFCITMAIHSSILAWRIPWTEEPGGLQSMGSQELDMT